MSFPHLAKWETRGTQNAVPERVCEFDSHSGDMTRMMRKNFKLIGRCHPWCGTMDYLVGRAKEKRDWQKEANGAQSTATRGPKRNR